MEKNVTELNDQPVTRSRFQVESISSKGDTNGCIALRPIEEELHPSGSQELPNDAENFEKSEDEVGDEEKVEYLESEVFQNGRASSIEPQSSQEDDLPTTRTQTLLQKLVGPIAKLGRNYATRKTARLVQKGGESSITQMNISNKKSRFLVDIFTTLLDMKWRYCILLFAMAFVLSWLFFAIVYYIICIVHEDHLHMDDPDWKPCHCNVYDFTTAFLFSLETQHTIGYGFRGMEPNCAPSIIALAFQSFGGAFLQCIVTGLVFAKLARPKRRSKTILFSDKAVIVQRDNHLDLLFRVGDMRRTHMIGTSIRAIMVKNHLTKEGEVIPFCQYPLKLSTETSFSDDSYLFLVWPVTVAHHINEDSPLWKISAEQLLNQHFEIIIILEGTVSTTSMTTQVRTSYLPSEILWGHRLAPLLTYEMATGGYNIDYTQFHSTVPLMKMAECSAQELVLRKRRKESIEDSNNNAHTFSNFATDIMCGSPGTKQYKKRFPEFPPIGKSLTRSLGSDSGLATP